jgi:putative metallohydrolase (TIGR04338 family)
VRRKHSETDRCYACEWDALPERRPRSLHSTRDFQSIDEIQEWVNLIVASPEWQSIPSAPLTITVRDNGDRNESFCATEEREIWIGQPMFRRDVVLHELAHLLTPENAPDHGFHFRVNYVFLLGEFLGNAFAARLRRSFERAGLKIN